MSKTIKLNGNSNEPPKDSIAAFFLEYCKLVGIDPTIMGPIQKREISRAFYGCAGKLLVFLKDEVAKMDEEDAIKKLEELIDETSAFWLKSSGKLN